MAKKLDRSSQGLQPPSYPATLGSALVPDQRATPTSGVRSAVDTPPAASYVPPRPAFDSEPMLTRITDPDPSLLAMSRPGEAAARRPRRRARSAVVWFALGTLTGGVAVWSVTSDVRADVDRARTWAASAVHTLKSQAAGEAPDPSEPPVASAPKPARADVAPTSASNAAPSPGAQPGAANTPQETAPAPPAAAAPAPTAPTVPTVDVGQLPHAQPSDPSASSPAPGAPTLTNAPGPR